MSKQVLLGVAVLVALFTLSAAFCAEKDLPKQKIIDIAVAEVKAKGIMDLGEVAIIYDEGGKLWCEHLGYVVDEKQYPNHGILKKGFLKNYRIVYFDFKEPIKDVWVFIDKDTGEVLTVYRE